MPVEVLDFILKILAVLLTTLISVGAAWLTAKIGSNQKLKGIAEATSQVAYAAQTTVGELAQTLVNTWKAEAVDGKLTSEQVDALGAKLIDMTIAKISAPALNLLDAAQVDISALIAGVGEAWIDAIKRSAQLPS